MAKRPTAIIHDVKDEEKKYVGKKELLIYGIAAGGQGMIYATMSSYISDFYINVMQLPLLFVLLLMLLARVWDAINDPLMGIIIDKGNTRWGKMKPYVLFTAIPIAVLTFFMFYVPSGLNMTEMMVYAAFIYVAWGMIYTASDVPFWSLPNVMTPNPAERGNTISFGRTVNGIGSAIPLALFAILGWIPYFSNGMLEAEKQRYIIMAIVASVIGIALFITSFFFVKERVIVPAKPKKEKSDGSMLKRILTCKPLMLVVLMGILSSGRYMMQAAAVHVARYAFYIGQPLEGLSEVARTAAIKSSVSTVSTIFTVCSAIGMFGSMLLMPFFYKRFNYRRIVIFTCISGFIASIFTTAIGATSIFVSSAGWLVYVCIPFIIIQCIPLGALNITAYAMIGDSLDYLEWKTGYRDNALGSACQSFVNKLGNAFSTTLIVLMYIAINLDPTQMLSESLSVAATDLPNGQRFAMFSLVSIIPGISLLICAIPVFWYDLVGGKKTKITRELEIMRAEKGIEIQK